MATFIRYKRFGPKGAVSSFIPSRNKTRDYLDEDPKNTFAEVCFFKKNTDPHVSKHWYNTVMMRGRNIKHN